VAAGAVAKKLLDLHGITITAYTVALGEITTAQRKLAEINDNPLFCPDNEAAAQMISHLETVRAEGDTLGGIVEILVTGCPAGLGEPVFEKLDAALAGALMSIGAVKGVEIGAGFKAAAMRGSENNDIILPEGFASNNSGGILAGISNGDAIVARVAVKPIPSIGREQRTINLAHEPVTVSIGGRHDISAIPRIIPVCEAMTALTLADHLLRQKVIA
jgi:chorismate synthase